MTTLSSDQAEEQLLLEGVLNGDNGAFKQLYTEYYASLCVYANKYLDDYSEAQDIVQETIFGIWDNRAKLDGIKSLKAYVYKTVYNKCLNLIKHSEVKQRHTSEALYKLKLIELEQEDSLIIKELGDKIEEAISHLPDKCRVCFQKKRLNGESLKDIATELGITEKAVEANLTRALKMLRKSLQKYLSIIVLQLLYLIIDFLKIM